MNQARIQWSQDLKMRFRRHPSKKQLFLVILLAWRHRLILMCFNRWRKTSVGYTTNFYPILKSKQMAFSDNILNSLSSGLWPITLISPLARLSCKEHICNHWQMTSIHHHPTPHNLSYFIITYLWYQMKPNANIDMAHSILHLRHIWLITHPLASCLSCHSCLQ